MSKDVAYEQRVEAFHARPPAILHSTLLHPSRNPDTDSCAGFYGFRHGEYSNSDPLPADVN